MTTIKSTKLTEKQVERITKRFVSKSGARPIFNQAYQTDQYIIATDTHSVVAINNGATEGVAINNLEIKGSNKFKDLEDRFITASPYNRPSTKLSLDYKEITALVKHLKEAQKVLKDKYTRTKVKYDKRLNELSFVTSYILQFDSEVNEFPEYYTRPSTIDQHSNEEFDMYFNTNYLINALTTQKETNRFTWIELEGENLCSMKFSNEASVVVIMPVRPR